MVEQLRHMDMLLELQAELFANMLKEAVSFVVLLCDQFQWYGRQFGYVFTKYLICVIFVTEMAPFGHQSHRSSPYCFCL